MVWVISGFLTMEQVKTVAILEKDDE